MNLRSTHVDQLRLLLLDEGGSKGNSEDDVEKVKSLIKAIRTDDRHDEIKSLVLAIFKKAFNTKTLSKATKLAIRDAPSMLQGHNFVQDLVMIISDPDIKLRTDNVLQVFCYLAEFGDCFRRKEIWEILCEGLGTLTNRLTTKRANYLMKRLLTDSSASLISEEERLKVVDVTLRREMWNDYFTVLETLEEPQAHIVNQVSGKITTLGKLVQFTQGKSLTEEHPLHLMWYLVIFRILLQHPNMTVMKCGLEFFLKQFAEIPDLSGHPLLVEFYKKSLFPALNTTKFYNYDQSGSNNLETLLSNFMIKSANDNNFWNAIIQSLCSVNWGSIPMLTVTKSMAAAAKTVNGHKVLTKESVEKLLSFMKLQTELPLFVGASRCYLLDVLTCLIDPRTVVGDDLRSGAEFVSKNFFDTAATFLVRGTPQWRKMLDWFQFLSGAGSDGLKTRIGNSSEDPQTLAMEILLVNDICNLGFLQAMTSCLIESMLESSDRLYRSSQVEVHVLSSLLTLVECPNKRKGREFLRYDESSRKKIEETKETFVSLNQDRCIEHLLSNLVVDQDDKLSESLIKILEFINKKFPSQNLNGMVLNGLRNGSITHFGVLRVFKSVLRQNLEVRKYLTSNLRSEDFWQNLQESKRLQEEGNWRLIAAICGDDVEHEILSRIVKAAKKSIERKTRSFQCVLKALKNISCGESDERLVQEDIFRIAMNFVYAQKKHSTFSPYLSSFMEMAWTYFLKSGKSRIQIEEIIVDLIKKADASVYIMPVLVFTLEECLKTYPDGLEEAIADFVIEFVTYGPVHRKENIQMNAASTCVANEGENLSVNLYEGSSHKLASDTRMKAMKILICLVSRKTLKVSRIVSGLKSRDQSVSKGKDRHFEHSLVHLTRHRVYQTLLLLTAMDLTAAEAEEIYEMAMDSIINQTQQLSVRYVV